MKLIINNTNKITVTDAENIFNTNKSNIECDENSITITIEKLTESQAEGYYKLKDGETIESICQRYKLPINAVKSCNEGITFKGGVTVYLPKTQCKQHIVQPQETLESISTLYSVSVDNLKENNGIDYVFAGQVLIV